MIPETFYVIFFLQHCQGSVDSNCLAGWKTEVSSPSTGEGLDSHKPESGDLQRQICERNRELFSHVLVKEERFYCQYVKQL